MVTDRELWAVALWIEAHQGHDGPSYISSQLNRFAREADLDGIQVWNRVAERYRALHISQMTH